MTVGQIPPINPPTDDVNFITSASIFDPMHTIVVTLDGHMMGTGDGGALNHTDTQIVTTPLGEGTVPTQSPVNQHVYNDGTYKALSTWIGGYPGAQFIAKIAAAAADMPLWNIVQQLRQHTHANAITGGQLIQANTHQTPDTDAAPASLHHTLGTSANQAAAGNHTHTGPQGYTGTTGVAAAVLRNAPGDPPAQNILVVQNNAGTLSYLNLSPTAATFNTPIAATQGVVGNVTGNVTGTVSGTSGGVTPLAIATGMIADSAITSVKIADGTIATADLADGAVSGGSGAGAKIGAKTITAANIADSTITSLNIADSTIQTADIAPKQITTGLIADSAVGALQIADGTVGTAELVDLNVTTGKLADGAVTSAKLAIGAFTLDKVAEGAVTAQSPQTTFVNIAALTRFNSNGQLKTYIGGSLDLALHINSLTASQNRFVLIAINGQGDAFPVPGGAVTGTLSDINRPNAPPDVAPLAYVTLRYGNNQIGPGDITVAREIFSYYGGSASGGSPVGHMHGRSAGESWIESIGMMEGRAHTTSTPSKNIIIEPFHYASTAGIVGQVGQTTLTIPDATGGGVSIFPISCLRSTGAIVIGTPVNSANVPPIASFPAFNLAQYVPLCYAISRTGQTAILDYDQSGNASNGYLVDARVWMSTGGTGGAGSGFNVIDGGTGQSGFAQGLIWQASSTTPSAALATVPATTNPQAGLAVQPTVPTPTPGGVQVDVIQLGGGANPPIANGLTGFSRMVGTHLLTPSKSGAGVATDAVSLLVDAGAGGTNNASAIFAGGARVGGITMPVRAFDVTGDIGGSGDVNIVGVTTFPTTNLTVGQTCYRRDLHALFMLESTGPSVWRQCGIPGFSTAGRPAASTLTDFRYFDLTDRYTYRSTGTVYQRHSTGIVQLNIRETTNLFNGLVSLLDSWQPINVFQSFTVEDTNSVIRLTLNTRIAIVPGAGGASLVVALTVDQPQANGSPLRIRMNGAFASASANGATGGGSVDLPAGTLAAGPHTLRAEYYLDGSASNLYLLAQSFPELYFLQMQVTEFKP
jgi:hypothetical protein